jgi:hypothetical protein
VDLVGKNIGPVSYIASTGKFVKGKCLSRRTQEILSAKVA